MMKESTLLSLLAPVKFIVFQRTRLRYTVQATGKRAMRYQLLTRTSTERGFVRAKVMHDVQQLLASRASVARSLRGSRITALLLLYGVINLSYYYFLCRDNVLIGSSF